MKEKGYVTEIEVYKEWKALKEKGEAFKERYIELYGRWPGEIAGGEFTAMTSKETNIHIKRFEDLEKEMDYDSERQSFLYSNYLMHLTKLQKEELEREAGKWN